MIDFTAIDFETAQGYRHTICQVGLVVVEDGRITTERSILVQPPDNYYWYRFTEIHGISAEDTAMAPNFAGVWPQISPYIENQNVVAHNGLGFDFPVLAKTLEFYGLPVPPYEEYCTYQIYGAGLKSLCDQYQIPLQHHDALSDARACAALFLRYLGI
ncbi:MAG: 3'-5' exonuclease [Spirochaetota bacterium]